MRIYLKLICILLVLISALQGSYAQDTSRQERRKAELEREIAIIDAQLSENASKSSSLLSDLVLIRKKVDNRKELVAESDRQIRRYSDRIYLAQKKINRMQARIDTLSDHYSRLVLSAYKNRDARKWYMYIIASENIGQAFRRYGYFKNLSVQMNTEAEKIRAAQEELEAEKASLLKLKGEAESVRKERKAELDKLRNEEAQADKVVKRLKKDRRKYEKQLEAKRKEVNNLNAEIQRIVKEAMKSSGKSSGKGGKGVKTKIDMKLASEFSKNKGKLPWPVDGPVVGRFGKHYHPVYKNLQLPPNNGVDIAVAKGTKVQAVFDGVVKQVIVMPGYNQCVLIQHGNYFTFYCKMKTLCVKAGDKIKVGQEIGQVDTINGQTQLHFQVWQDTRPQNPESWLK